MANYRDPKVTTPTTQKRGGGMSKWIWIILALIVAILLIAWLWGGNDETIEGEVVPVVPPPAAEGTAPAPATDTATIPTTPAPATTVEPATPVAPAPATGGTTVPPVQQ